MLPQVFYPKYVKNNKLIRIGPKNDGGYIVHKDILKNINFIISCGLSDEWRFEKELLLYCKKSKVLAFDHTVNSNFWLKYTFKNIFNFFLLKKLTIAKIIDIFKYIDYKNFFSRRNKHFLKKIGNKNNKNEITINSIIKNYYPYKKKIILKVDIEGDEYNVLNNIIKNEKKIDHLIIEFHNVVKNLKKIINFIKQNKFLKLIHIHGNNYGQVINGIPDVLEMTFVNKVNYKRDEFKNSTKYPIYKLDYPNHKRRDDIRLKFSDE